MCFFGALFGCFDMDTLGSGAEGREADRMEGLSAKLFKPDTRGL